MSAKKTFTILATTALGGMALMTACHGSAQKALAPAAQTCNLPETGLTLPPGFCATVYADHLGHARHMAMTADGTLYVNTWSGRYYRNAPPSTGAFIVALRDTHGTGHADSVVKFGPTAEQGNAGGDGLALWHGALFVESNDRIVRYPLAPGRMEATGPGETVLSGMPLDGNHPMHPFAIDTDGNLLVNMGSPTNSCQQKDRTTASKGIDPCPQLAEHAGIWHYRADRLNQKFSPAERWATGIRNTGGISLDAGGRIYAVQHGRDQLGQNWGTLFTTAQGVELPSEELLAPRAGDDFGWPYCYHDPVAGHLMLAPEYGGDGKEVGRCATKKEPVAAFPAHWAPNDVLAWHPGHFPSAYDNGVFIAFHGSWNRAPAPQAGYQIGFQPLRDGRPAGHWIRFADGFAGGYREPGRAAHRPAGLAQGSDGALYIADDVGGRIWRITYRGDRAAPLTPAPEAALAPAATGGSAGGVLPPGYSAADVEAGRRIFAGEAKGGTCSGCHGSDGRGSSAGASLVGPTYLWSDGSVARLAATITKGVPVPRNAGGPMPAKGGADLTDADIGKVAAYVWTLGHHDN
jgi:glucose/arabinose dehydrogenase